MNNTSGVLNVIFIGLLLVFGLIVVNQFNSINDVQDDLDIALASSTQFAQDAADSLNSANANATQAVGDAAATLEQANADAESALEQANADSTQFAEDASASSTQAASDAADAQNSLIAEATEEVFAVQATADAQIADLEASLADSVALAGELAVQVGDAESELSLVNTNATVIASRISSTATQQANALADAQATVSSLEQAVADAQATSSALEAEQSAAATNTPVPTSTPVPGQLATENAEENEDDSDEGDSAETKIIPPDGFILFTGQDFEMLLPDDFIAFDLRTDQDDAIETFGDLGIEYIGLQSIARTDDFALMVGGAEEPNRDGTVDLMLMITEELPAPMPMSQYLEQAITFLGADTILLDEDIVEIDGKDVGVLYVENTAANGIVNQQLVFVHNVDDVMHLIFFATVENRFDAREGAYEISGESFRPR